VGFKPIIKGPSINLARKKKEALAKHLFKLVQKKMAPLKNTLHRDAYEMIMNLLSLVSTGFRGYEYMNKREVVVAKLAEYCSESLEISVHRTCSEMLQILNCLKDSYVNTDV
jgi:hypothetical protein